MHAHTVEKSNAHGQIKGRGLAWTAPLVHLSIYNEWQTLSIKLSKIQKFCHGSVAHEIESIILYYYT